MSITNIRPNETPAALLSPTGKTVETLPRQVFQAFETIEAYCGANSLTWHLECQRCGQPVTPRDDLGTDVFLCRCRERRITRTL